jgi:G8 domain
MYPYFYKWTLATQKVAVCLQLLLPVAGFATTITSTNSGGSRNWTDPDTWVNGSVPTSSDAAIIAPGASVTIDDNLILQSLTIRGTLTFETATARKVIVNGNVVIDNTGTFQTGNTGNVTTDTLSLSGDLMNNGILDFSTDRNTVGANITFRGATHNTFGGSGVTTDILNLTVDKGTTKTPILLLNPTTLTIQGQSSNAPRFLNLLNGTLHIAGTFVLASELTIRNTNLYTFESTTGFWLDNPNFTVQAAPASIIIKGLLKIEQGIFNVGLATNDNLSYYGSANISMIGGELNVAGKIMSYDTSPPTTPITLFEITGGVINICTQGNDSKIPSFYVRAKTLKISGGMIILNKGATEDYFAECTTANISITGGFLTCLSNATDSFNIHGAIPNLQITGNAPFAISGNSTVYGNIEINNNATLNLDTFKLKVKGNIQNNGTIKSHLHNDWEKGCMDFMGNSAQTYSGTGIFGTVAAPINSFSMNNTTGVTIDANSNALNINGLYLFKGSINNSSKLTFCDTPSFVAKLQYGAADIATVSGNLDAAPDFTNLTAGLAIFYYKETNTRTTGFEIPPNRIINKLTLSSNTINLSGGNLNVVDSLQFSNGKINIGNHNLILESAAAVTGANNNGYVVTNGTGRLTRKGVSNTETLFPVGTTTTYDPASITNAGTTDDFSVHVASNLDAFSPMPTKYIQRQWNISEATAGGSDVTLSLTCAAGVPTNNFEVALPIEIGHYKSTNVWERLPATMSGSVATASNITSFSPFVIINQSSVLPVELIDFKGVANGNQNIIRWSTASEKDTKCFILERRNNYEDFKSLDLVAATGDVKQPQFYQWVDHTPVPLSMYRLKIMDLNGSYDYSKVISVENAGGDAMSILAKPAEEEWMVRLTDVPLGAGTISVFDMQGKLQGIQNIDIQSVTTDIKLSINNLINGSYILICNVGGQILSKKWVKI